MRINKIDLGYMAAFLDGEGSIGAHYNSRDGKNHFSVRISISQKKTGKPLMIFKKYFGGGIYYRKDRNSFRYGISGKKSEKLLSTLLPILKVKNKQAKIALELISFDLRIFGSRGDKRLKNKRRNLIIKRKWYLAKKISILNSGGRSKFWRKENDTSS